MGLLKKVGLVGLVWSQVFQSACNIPPTPRGNPRHTAAIEELRAFSEVFGRIKSDYVEPVSDKKLINEAINGMVSGLDLTRLPRRRSLQGIAGRHARRIRRTGHRKSAWKTAW